MGLRGGVMAYYPSSGESKGQGDGKRDGSWASIVVLRYSGTYLEGQGT